MITIIFIATPCALAQVSPNSGHLVHTYHISTIYRGREKYKVYKSISINGIDIYCKGRDKNGWQPFCEKWAKRIAALNISFGHNFNPEGGLMLHAEKKLPSGTKIYCDYSGHPKWKGKISEYAEYPSI
jgi:hypothetical protein